MSNVKLEPELVFHYFEEICKVPHPSKKEEKMTAWIMKVGEELGLTFCHKGGVICISEVINISPSNLDSSLCFFQFSVSHDVLCI